MTARIETDDERNRQAKSLTRWEQQKAEWDRIQRRLARHVGKPDGAATLPGSIHSYRMRTEELGMIDASVPAEVKNGVSAWEMNLRASSGGVRYVQVGSSYPYPLYCPIRDAESVKPDNNTLMKVIPEVVPHRDKPVSDGEYFKTRQHEFQRHIKRKFAHYTASSFFGIEGSAPPVSANPIAEDASVAPVVFVPAVQRQAGTPSTASGEHQQKHNAHLGTRGGADEQPSRPLSAAIAGKLQSAVLPVATNGPALVLSTAHLHFAAAPQETVQATLRIENTGSTAVFFSWTTSEGDATLPLSPTAASGNQQRLSAQANADSLFRMSNVPNAVLLPDEAKYFTVSFRSTSPGIFSSGYELLTVPAGRERIIVHMRAVVVGAEGDTLRSASLHSGLDGGAAVEEATSIVNDILLREKDNAFDAAAIHRQITARKAAIAADAERVQREADAKKRQWIAHNGPQTLRLGFNIHVYETLNSVYNNVTDFVEKQAQPVPKLQGNLERPSWSGSMQDLYEHIGCVRDVDTRAAAMDTTQSMLLCAAAVSTVEDERLPLDALMWRAAGRTAWGAAAERIHQASQAARELSEGRTLVKAGASNALSTKEKGGAGGKAAAAPAAKKGAAPAAAVPLPDTVDKVNTPEYDAIFFTLARRCIGDAIDQTIDTRAGMQSSLRATCLHPLSMALGQRFEVALAVADKEAVEPFADPNAAKAKGGAKK